MEMLVSKSKIKELVKELNVSSKFAEALNEVAVESVKGSVEKAKANNRKTITDKDVFISDEKNDVMLVVKSKIKEVANDCNVSGTYPEALNNLLVFAVRQAVKVASANGRKTVMPYDL